MKKSARMQEWSPPPPPQSRSWASPGFRPGLLSRLSGYSLQEIYPQIFSTSHPRMGRQSHSNPGKGPGWGGGGGETYNKVNRVSYFALWLSQPCLTSLATPLNISVQRETEESKSCWKHLVWPLVISNLYISISARLEFSQCIDIG